MITKYDKFISESIFSKAKQGIANLSIKSKEIVNRKELQNNDKIGDKWINKIKEDWLKNKNPLKIQLNNNESYISLTYVISDSKTTIPSSGNRNKGDIDIKFLLINKGGWDNDISGARIEVSMFIPYKGNLLLIGRDMKDNSIIQSDNGLKGDYYDYINISKSKAEGVINFIRSEINRNFPKLKDKDITLNNVFDNYPNIKDNVNKELKLKRENDKSEYYKKQKDIRNNVISKSKNNLDEIMDMMYDLEDYDNLLPKIYISDVDDGIMTILSDDGTNTSKFNTNGRLPDGVYYIVKLDFKNTELDKGIEYYVELSNKIQTYLSKNRRIRSKFDYIGKCYNIFADQNTSYLFRNNLFFDDLYISYMYSYIFREK